MLAVKISSFLLFFVFIILLNVDIVIFGIGRLAWKPSDNIKLHFIWYIGSIELYLVNLQLPNYSKFEFQKRTMFSVSFYGKNKHCTTESKGFTIFLSMTV